MNRIMSMTIAAICVLLLTAFIVLPGISDGLGNDVQEAEPPADTKIAVVEISDEVLLMHRALKQLKAPETGDTCYYYRGTWNEESVYWVAFEPDDHRFPAPINNTTIYQTVGAQNYFEQVQFSYELSDGTKHDVEQYRIYLAEEESERLPETKDEVKTYVFR